MLDNLSNGHREALPPEAKFVQGDIRDQALLEAVISEHRIDTVVHFAGLIEAGVSMHDPAPFWEVNVGGTLTLLAAMRNTGCDRIVLSSTAAVYSPQAEQPITEEAPLEPVSTYGWTKLTAERALADHARSHGFCAIALRYFNAAGATIDGSHGEDHHPETHLIPLAMQAALGRAASIKVFGDDYDTPDGTCIRDYVHVEDLATAHVLAVDALPSRGFLAVNLGTGVGTSVRELIAACVRITGRDITVVPAQRRAGDSPRLIASNALARQNLGWSPRLSTMDSILSTAWRWHSTRPGGYDSAAGPSGEKS